MFVDVKDVNTSLLTNISAGQCFAYGKDYYMRVNIGGTLGNGEQITAINLNSGVLCAFTLMCHVIPVKLKVVNDN